MTWQKLYFLKKHIFISQGNEIQITIVLWTLMPSLHLYILTIILFQDLHAQPNLMQKKKYQKSFHFHLTHQYLPLIMSKGIFKKDNLKPKSRSQKSIQRFRLMHLSYFFMTEKTCRVSFRALVSTSWKKPVVEDTI